MVYSIKICFNNFINNCFNDFISKYVRYKICEILIKNQKERVREIFRAIH